jgi:hypothetical protein
MIFRGITASNDWTFGKGVGSYFTREEAIAANLKTSLLFFLNDCFFAMTTGIDWWNLLGSKNPAAKNNILLQTRQAIIQAEGVVRINSVDVQLSTTARRVTISYNIDTIYSRNVTGSMQTP